MWLKKSVHFEQHYLSKWKIIQPRALQWDLSLFLQLLKTIPEVNSSWCSCILIFCRAEKLSGPYFSTCKTNFLWLKSEFTAVSLQCFARSTGKLPNLPAAMREQGNGGRKMSSSGMNISPCINFQVFPMDSFTSGFGCVKETWSLSGVCGGSGPAVRQTMWVVSQPLEYHTGVEGWDLYTNCEGFFVRLSPLPRCFLCSSKPSPDPYSAEGHQGWSYPASPPSAPLPASPPSPLWHITFPDPSPHSLLCLSSPPSRCHSSGSGLTRPLQKDYFSFFNH